MGSGALTRNIVFAILAAVSVGVAMAGFYAAERARHIPDESIAQAVVGQVLQSGSPDTNWVRTQVQARFHYDEYNFSSYYLTAAAYESFVGRTAVDIKNPNGLVPHVRDLSVILGALCVFFAGVLGWRMGGAVPALVSGLLTAVSPALFQHDLYARPESFATLLTLLLMIMLTAGEGYAFLTLACAGLLIGFLVATKVTFLVYLPFPLLLASRYLPAQAERTHSRWTLCILGYFAAIGLGFLAGAPYAVKFPAEYLRGVASLLDQYGNGVLNNHRFSLLLESLWGNWTYLVYVIGLPALLLAACGAASLARRGRWAHVLILTAPLLLLLYFLRMKPYFERNFCQSLPALFLLAGLGVQAVADVLRKPPRLQLAIAAALTLACAVLPAMVSARIIHPALDGSFQEEIDAETARLSQDGRVTVIDTDYLEAGFCGAYAYRVRYPDHYKDIEALERQGFTEVARVETPFDGHPYTTLETYLAPTMVFLAPAQTNVAACDVGLMPLADAPALAPLPAHVSADAAWTPGGTRSSLPDGGWRWPLYGSWSGSDAKAGGLHIGPFRACDDFIVPYTTGAGHANFSLTLTRRTGKTDAVIYSGIPPASPHTWQALHVRVTAGACADYSIDGDDAGAGWEQWLGVGVPVHEVAGHR